MQSIIQSTLGMKQQPTVYFVGTAVDETNSELSDYTGNAIVYLLHLGDEEDASKDEIQEIRTLSDKPTMILALTPTGIETVSDVARKLGLEDRISSQKEAGEGRPLGLFMASLPLNKGYQEGQLLLAK
ncbi:hypothetical protein H0H92_015896 [Tricholoma furcatifolium]|nr:hypothetical protein H0H92_015896 [Tricholoma furcatifolium]